MWAPPAGLIQKVRVRAEAATITVRITNPTLPGMLARILSNLRTCDLGIIYKLKVMELINNLNPASDRIAVVIL